MKSSPEPDFQPAEVMMIDDLETLKLIYDPLRLQILEAFHTGPRSVKQVAAELRMRPNKLYYHVNRLESAGIIKMVRTQITGHMVEKLYQTAARHFQMQRDNPSNRTPDNISQAQQRLQLTFNLFMRTAEQSFAQGLATQQIDPFQNPPDAHALLLWNGYISMSPTLALQTQQKIIDLLFAIENMSDPSPEEERLRYAYAVLFTPTALLHDTDDEPAVSVDLTCAEQENSHENPDQ